MTGRSWLAATLVCAIGMADCGRRQGPHPGEVQDEAMRAGLNSEHFIRPTPDYFADMDDNLVGGKRPVFTQQEIEGRNMWMVWTGGNERLWDRLTIDSIGSFDLLKTISSHPKVSYGRHNRFYYLGLINEPSRLTEPVHLLLPTQLIVRRSCAPPAR